MRDSVFAIRSDPVSRRSGPSLATILLPRQWALLDNTESIDSLHLQESGVDEDSWGVTGTWCRPIHTVRSDSESHGQNGILRRRYGGAAVGFTGVFSSSSALLKISFKIGMWPHSVR
mmetsp:Transcript_53899/g.115642  ORF Transcript_53899/g.115642 Transcript_53899/m.115642 type:complete len:117 (+) Transcript_53899:1106-1456(+)